MGRWRRLTYRSNNRKEQSSSEEDTAVSDLLHVSEMFSTTSGLEKQIRMR